LKASGEANWPKMDQVIKMIEDARRRGVKITADMYTYPAGGTGLDASLPPWVFDGGREAAYRRLQDPATRQKIAEAVRTPTNEWENLYLLSGSPERILLASFRNDNLKPLTGKTLADVAKMRGKDPIETIMDLLLEDRSRVGTIYFLMSEDNIKKQIRQPWVSFGSDAASIAAEGVFLKSAAHPRTYGNFARLLGKYVRDEKVISLTEAVRRLTSLPATNLGLNVRGRRHLRSADDCRPFDIRKPTPILSRRSRRFCERATSAQEWRAHRCQTWKSTVGAGKSRR